MPRPSFSASRIAAWLALGAALPLAACVPAPLGSYYKPSLALDSTRSRSYSGTDCQGRAGAPAVLHLALDSGVALRIDAMPTHGAPASAGRPLHIVIDVPRATTVRFEPGPVRVSDDGGRHWRELAMRASVSAAVAPVGRVVMSELAPTPLDALQPGSFRASATLAYAVPDFAPAAFTMQVPPIRIAGVGVEPRSDIAAQAAADGAAQPGPGRVRRPLVYTTPESRARLEQRIGACQARRRAGAASMACDELRQYDPGGFERELGPFTLSGRWYVYDVQQPSPLQGELRVAYRQPLDWAFDAPQLRLLDASGGKAEVALQRLRLSFGYDVALDTPVRGVNDAEHAGPTTLSLNADLGTPQAGSYRVQLPALHIDGKQLDVPALELTRHALDVGWLPFNC